MIAPWLLFALLTPLLYPVANYCDKVALDRFPLTPAQLCAVMYIGFSLLVIVTALLLGGPISTPSAGLPPFLAGVLFVVYSIPYYRALTLDEASAVIPLFQFSSLFVILIEVGFLGERLSLMQSLGTALILGCGFACAVEKTPQRIFQVRPTLWLMLLASALYAASGPLMRFGLTTNSLDSSLFYQGAGMLVAGIALYAAARPRELPIRALASGLFLTLVTLNAIVTTVALVGTTRAVGEVSATLVRVAAASQPIFVFLLGALLTRLCPRYVREDLSRRTVIRKSIVGCGILGGAYLLQIG